MFVPSVLSARLPSWDRRKGVFTENGDVIFIPGSEGSETGNLLNLIPKIIIIIIKNPKSYRGPGISMKIDGDGVEERQNWR